MIEAQTWMPIMETAGGQGLLRMPNSGSQIRQRPSLPARVRPDDQHPRSRDDPRKPMIS